jgi:predicted ATPase/class 3 adenylate cyclase
VAVTYSTAAERLSGTVTFLLSDVAGSTAIWEAEPAAARAAIARYDEIVEEAVGAHGGSLLKSRGEGDSHFAVFDQAQAATSAALAIALALASEPWTTVRPIRVRMALHTGTADLRGGDYYGPEVNRCARLRAIGHPGQVLLSNATAALVRWAMSPGCGLAELGWHHLRDVAAPEQVFQLTHPDLLAEFPPLTTEERHHNVPAALTSFIGRAHETTEVERLVTERPLVTLLGTGGIGKSRLAFQVAGELLPRFSDGAFVVELAPLMDPALVPQQVLFSVGIAEEPGRSHTDTVVASLARRHMLLVLDGCEHLLEACAALVEALLRSCPKVRILATSREPFRIVGETTWRVPSLSVPEDVDGSGAEIILFDSVRLFVNRAVQSKPDFTVSDANAAAITEVCRRLGGIPLALELAATRVKVLGCDQIATRLNNQFRLLTGGARNALPRHQTLRATVDWSYDLLSDFERGLFRRLSVFAGAFSLEAAEEVCCGGGCGDEDILDLLSSLVDKSLVVVEERNGRVRYRFLETLRQYAAERLREAGESVAWSDRHLAWYLAEAQRAEPELKGPEQGSYLDLLEEEHDNLRVALAWALEGSSAADAVRLAVTLSRFWLVRGYLSEGRRWLETCLATTAEADDSDRAKALIAASTLAWHQGDYAGVGPLAERALEISRKLGDKVGVAEALCRLGELRTMTGDHIAAWSLFEQSKAAWAESGAKRGVIQSLNVPLHDLGTLACEQGDYAAAESLFEEALDIAKEHGNIMDIVHHLSGLGHVARGRGDYEAAKALYGQSLAMARRLGYKRMTTFNLQYLAALAWKHGRLTEASELFCQALAYFGPARDDLGVARCLEGLCKVAAGQGAYERAALLSALADRLREGMHSPLPPSEVDDYRAALERASAALTPEQFDVTRAEARSLDLDVGIDIALRDSAPSPLTLLRPRSAHGVQNCGDVGG